MTSRIHKKARWLTLVLASAAVVASLAPTMAVAAEAPIKQIVASHIGWNVNGTKEREAAPQAERNVCTVQSKNECQFGTPTTETGGFLFPEGVAVNNASALVSPEHGDLYVADTGNQRVQVFSSTGAFVLMFGWNVNRTKEEEGASQAERNVCTATSGDACQAGATGESSGEFSSPTSVAVDPATGNVYVEDVFNWRVQEFTASGEFVLMLGKEVNETTGSNLCTATSKDTCKTGAQSAEGSTEPAAFKFVSNHGGLLQIGGPEGLLYVGDQQRIETFKADGTPVGEVSLTSISAESGSSLSSFAVDQAGDVYAAYVVNSAENFIYELGPKDEELKHFELSPKEPQVAGVEIQIRAMALDSTGQLVVAERERGNVTTLRGALYEVGTTTLSLLTDFVNEFPTESSSRSALSLAFDGQGDMYGVGGSEVISYNPVRTGSLANVPAVCKAGADNGTDATFECELKSEANPWSIPETEVWFQWGRTSVLGSRTEPQLLASVETPLRVTTVLTGLLPNETYYYRPVGEDQDVKAPEIFSGEMAFVVTEAVPPRIIGEPEALHAGPFSAVMFAQINPENINTKYEFQYGPCEDLSSCPGLVKTMPVESPSYGAIGTAVEATGLLPDTLYYFRLVAESTSGKVASNIGTFTTAGAPAVTAETGFTRGVTTTSAIVSGVVNPGGQAATYTYELGRYNGSNTEFGVVFSGPAGAATTPTEPELALSGLQPGTTYAYRIAIHSGDGSVKGEEATGATLTFTTEGLPAVFVPNVSPLLPLPSIPFPIVSKPLTNAQKLAIALKACRHGSKRQRVGCERKARKRYPKSKKT